MREMSKDVLGGQSLEEAQKDRRDYKIRSRTRENSKSLIENGDDIGNYLVTMSKRAISGYVTNHVLAPPPPEFLEAEVYKFEALVS